VCGGDCKSILQAQEEEREVGRRAREISLKDIEERGTMKVFKPSKVTKEYAQNSGRIAEEVREQLKYRGRNCAK
jgi:hypothetical protein